MENQICVLSIGQYDSPGIVKQKKNDGFAAWPKIFPDGGLTNFILI